MEITKKQILKTAFLPGIIPRLKDFFSSGFTTLAYSIAVVYSLVRILPANHPYLRADMKGRYSLIQVIGEAANHIKIEKKNIDQILIFIGIIAALVILFVQFFILIFKLVITQAQAQVTMPTEIEGFFTTPNPQEDIAFRLLDLVFGVPDFFGSKEKTGTALHQALQSMFEFYSYCMIIVGAMIIVYLVVAIVAETAQSGTPFGQRFNKAWAPIRVILFFGLLIPLSNGFNGGQYITLAAAKLGSGFATTGWIILNKTIKDTNTTLTGERENNIATPDASDLSHLPAFMMIVKTCQLSYNYSYNTTDYPEDIWNPDGAETGVKAWIVYKVAPGPETEGASGASTKITYASEILEGQTFQDLTAKSNGQDIHMVFGVKNAGDKFYRANISPICGSVVMKVTDMSEPGTAVIQTAYFNIIKNMWDGDQGIWEDETIWDGPPLWEADNKVELYADNYTKRHLELDGHKDSHAKLPDLEYRESWVNYLKEYMEREDKGVIDHAVKAQIDDGNWEMPQKVLDYGWGGAGIWYNNLAQQNGAMVTAIRQVPMAVMYPSVMEKISENTERQDNAPSADSQNTPSNSADTPDNPNLRHNEAKIAETLSHLYQYWQANPLKLDRQLSGNVVIDTINAILGTGGLFEICENTNIHPLAQLSAVGKSMIDSSISAFAMSGIFGLASIIPVQLSASFSAASGFFGTIAGVGLMVGFILFYVLPFMPFIYFFFAVGGWVKGIFEAMVAMPLWAIAHLRIDGEGIAGEAAIGGYFLIFEIFIRPILIVFGLIAAITIFAGMIKVLNGTFYLILSNLSGHSLGDTACFTASDTDAAVGGATDPSDTGKAVRTGDFFRGPIDEFFYTVLYTIIVYMIGMSCFKLIDSIPNNILRWINAEVPSFNDNAGDAAEGLMTYIALGGSQIGGVGSSLGGIGSGMKEGIQSFFKDQ